MLVLFFFWRRENFGHVQVLGHSQFNAAKERLFLPHFDDDDDDDSFDDDDDSYSSQMLVDIGKTNSPAAAGGEDDDDDDDADSDDFVKFMTRKCSSRSFIIPSLI